MALDNSLRISGNLIKFAYRLSDAVHQMAFNGSSATELRKCHQCAQNIVHCL